MRTSRHSSRSQATVLTPRYLTLWAILAALALGYLTLLVVRPELAERLIPSPGFGAPEDNRGQRALARAMTELKEMREAMVGLERDLGELRKTVTAGDTRDVALAGRVGALESVVRDLAKGETGRTATPAPAAATSAAEPASGTPRVLGYVEERPTKSAREAARPGEPPKVAAGVVTPAPAAPKAPGPQVGLELASGPSLDALRLAWQLVQDSHKAAVKGLEPRVVESAGDPPSYRLIAGPVAGDGEADKICAKLRQRRLSCSVQPFAGKPL